MAWIESHTVLARHRKVQLLAYDLNISIVQTIGHLHAFWHSILEQQEDGDLSEWPDEMIEDVALWEGNVGELVARLRARGWIDGHLVHDWLDYTGKFLHSKYSTSNPTKLMEIYKKHGYKYGKGKGKYGKVIAQEKRKVSADQAPTKRDNQPLNQPLNQPTLTNPNLNTSEDEPTQAQATGRMSSAMPTADRPRRTRDDNQPTVDRSSQTLDGFTLTPELEAWSAKEGILNPGQYIEEFKDYWLSAGCRRKNGQVVKHWAAAFRNRLRVLKEQGKLKKPSLEERMQAWAKEETG